MPDPAESMTWGEFKAAVEAAGVMAGDHLEWIDVHLPSTVLVSRSDPQEDGTICFTVSES